MFKIDGLVFPLSFNTNKVMYVAEAVAADYEVNHLDMMKGELQTETHLKKHPFGKTPALTHGDKILFESGAICKYIASVSGSDLYPVSDHYQRCLVDQWMDFFTAHMGRWCSTALFQDVFKKEFGMGEKDEKAYAEATDFFNKQAAGLNNHLEDKKYLCGDKMTIADIFAFAYLETAETAGLPLSKYSNMKKWVSAMSDQSFVTSVKKKYYS